MFLETLKWSIIYLTVQLATKISLQYSAYQLLSFLFWYEIKIQISKYLNPANICHVTVLWCFHILGPDWRAGRQYIPDKSWYVLINLNMLSMQGWKKYTVPTSIGILNIFDFFISTNFVAYLNYCQDQRSAAQLAAPCITNWPTT